MKILPVIMMLAIFLPASAQATFGLDECMLKGWINTADKKVPFVLHINYKRDRKSGSWSYIDSLTIDIADERTVFPAAALKDSGSLGAPSGVVTTGREHEYLVCFSNCGDGARSYSVDFIIRDGRLREKHLIAKSCSELRDSIRIFDRHGAVIYDGPCDRQGKPLKAAPGVAPNDR